MTDRRLEERVEHLENRVRALLLTRLCHCGHRAVEHLSLFTGELRECSICYPACRAYSPPVEVDA
jgi:hypothetical protein